MTISAYTNAIFWLKCKDYQGHLVLDIEVAGSSSYGANTNLMRRRGLLRRGRVVRAFASHFSCTYARNPGSNLTTAIGPATARTRLTQPATFSWTANRVANRVPASAGLMAGMSPLSGGR